RRLRTRVRVERGIRDRAAARPEARAADFVRVRLARDAIGKIRNATGMLRRPPAGEARHREIRRAPEVVHGTDLADEARAERLEYAIRLHERAPVPLRGVSVVRAVRVVALERDGVGHF